MTRPPQSDTNSLTPEVLSKTYDPKGTERRWQEAWERNNAFHPDSKSDADPFSIVIPPPNVTGSLHMGHAFNTALIDTIVRFQRLQGKNVLCLPGTDHASIAVQTILEKQLDKEGLTLNDLGREGFLQRAWEWKSQSGGQINDQLRRLGFSVDWNRQRFTLDEGLSAAVVEGFVRLHKQGLIYRGEYLVNWCPASSSAVSDLEVDMKEVDGFLWHFKYPLTKASSSEGRSHLEVATTRPETMFGDVAVAVNPSDTRYKYLIGQTVTLPLSGREIPVIGDDHVDQAFGTGCVKVTPAHDFNDFEIGQRHDLPQITVMNKDGSMNHEAGSFAGLDRFEARKEVIKALEKEGLLVKTETYRHSVPYSDRGKVPVEPLISTQWFVRMESMAENCQSFFEKAEPRFVPERWGKVYKDWLTDIRDWCISRQLWWGHRIPAWFVVSETNGTVTNCTPYVVAHSEQEAFLLATKKFGEAVKIQQDEDVLDTWFSSGLWPFSTLGWPDETAEDFNCWYPTTTLVTGFDIIFFWVARMTMMAGAFTDQMPFKDVYIHGLVRDEQNRKMSKSLGNGIDPLLLINQYGTDALRFALVREVAGAGQDIRLDYDRKRDTSQTVEAARNFANKLWNATRFALINFQDSKIEKVQPLDINKLQQTDLWILSRLIRVSRQTREKYHQYSLGEAAKGLYEFAWNDICDWYLELIKNRLNKQNTLEDRQIVLQVLFNVLTDLFVILHPLMPHLTEELWHSLTGFDENILLAKQSWPNYDHDFLDDELEDSFSNIFEIIRLIRNLRSVAGLKPSQSASIRIITSKKDLLQTLSRVESDIKFLTKVENLDLIDPQELNSMSSVKSLSGFIGDVEVILPVEGLIDLHALRDRLEKDIAKADKDIITLSSRLSNPNYLEKAPLNVVKESKIKLAEAKAQAELARNRLKEII